MFKYLLRLFMLLAVFLGLVALIGILLPRAFRIEREVEIAANREAVFAEVGDLERWIRWSPWSPSIAPEITYQIVDDDRGVDDRALAWNDPRGPGRLWLIAVRPPELVEFALSVARFREIGGRIRLEPTERGTRLTWVMAGRLPNGLFYGFAQIMFRGEMHRQMELCLDKLKRMCETRATVDVDDEGTPASPREGFQQAAAGENAG